MPRPTRIEYPNAYHHVMNRGVAKNIIYFESYHYQLFVDLMEKYAKKYKVEVISYCLMQNHFHMLLHTPEMNLSLFLQCLCSAFVRRVNREINRDGPLFRSRFKSILVEYESYLLRCCRYIHLNPVEGGLVKDPQDYTWSTHKYYMMGDLFNSEFINTSKVLDRFRTLNQYNEFIQLGVDSPVKKVLTNKKLQSVIGSDRFIKYIHDTFKKKGLETLETQSAA